MTNLPFAQRMKRVRAAMQDDGCDAVLLSVGPDLPWLCGYEAMPLERLTALVVTAESATLLVPALEAPRVTHHDDLFQLRPWGETEDPIALTSSLLGSAASVAVGDKTWARFLVELMEHKPQMKLRRATDITGPLRELKDPHEITMLHNAGAAIDEVTAAIQAGDVPLIGRSEAEVAADLSRRILDVGHHRVNFAIVAAGGNSASPHHEPGDRIIEPDEAVLVDIGGTMLDEFGVGYCSDMTRCYWTGEPSGHASEVYEVLRQAHRSAVDHVAVGVSCESIDRAARSVIEDAGHGAAFMHRTGHGMGVEEHEDPYIVEGNSQPVEAGHCFSIEPGIYLSGQFGFRLEDCVVAASWGADCLTSANHDLVIVD